MGLLFLAEWLLPLLLLCAPLSHASPAKSYVVYLGPHKQGAEVTERDIDAVRTSHYNLLGSILGSERAHQSIIYSYTHYINGFAAVLDDAEAAEIAKNPNVLSVFPNKAKELHTTRSWHFLGLEKDGGVIRPDSIWEKARFGEDTIIANLDTGVWPESASFSDEGFGPIPSRWKGICQQGIKDKFPCNRKLIGVRYFDKGYIAEGGIVTAENATARDFAGHGSHTLSTAGGNFVHNVSIYGFAKGSAKGGSPSARVAAYKVCWPPVSEDQGGCFDADILAAFDTAIADGVDVISFSVGGDPSEFFSDSIAIGSFHAVAKGIPVVASASNSGPKAGTVTNVAPWLFTIAASTLDREFRSYVALGNRTHLVGTSFSARGLPAEKFYPLITAVDAKAANATITDAILCKPGTLDPNKVKGKILICLRGLTPRLDKGVQARKAGAVGMILANDEADGEETKPDPHVLPVSHINYRDGLTVYAYYASTRSPVAYITRARTVLDTKPAPFVAKFSSRGPNTIEPAILKPDITAPGVDVIAAYTEAPDPEQPYEPILPYNLLSGTSMSCPHVSGIVGLIRTAYPKWSPAAIKSAIMTTAVSRDNRKLPILDSSFKKANAFDYGAGHIRPSHVLDPGLVYDLGRYDYINFLCGRGYTTSMIRVFEDEPYTCPPKFSISNFNYPSITIPGLRNWTAVYRRVTNVGPPGKYVARVDEPEGVAVSVRPSVLVFKETGEEKEFNVVFKTKAGVRTGEYVYGSLVWSDGKHIVRSPLVVRHQ
ncbi:hypothetical protein MLD38_022118 [Melastoma candidum]|uniref:Uncharacterized protein n=1 Tax=Melastoma candidum TaxID=119954 RepID=A0ACB9QM40_9MYRT|nr:hypothetical protein MLD38_022118 [Melastoma candidum]